MVYVGFTGNQDAQLTALKSGAGLIAPSRVAAFPSPPQHSLAELASLEAQIEALADAQGLPIAKIGTDVKNNTIIVGTSNVAQVSGAIAAALGANRPIAVVYDPRQTVPRSGRERIEGQIHAGDRFTGDQQPLAYFCSANFGAFDVGRKPSNNELVFRYFMLTAGHCANLGERMRRRDRPGEGNKTIPIGITERRGWDQDSNSFDTDASAIRLESPELTPRYIYTREENIPINGVVAPRIGMIVCQSGVTSNEMRCGKIEHLAERIEYDGQKMLQVQYDANPLGGDSGAPVWQQGTGSAVGIVTAGTENSKTGEEEAPGYFTPLLSVAGRPNMPGAFQDPGLAPLHLVVALGTGATIGN